MSQSAGQNPETVEGPTQEEFVAWVQEFLSRLESVDRSSNRHWCPQWWAHTEAVDRLATLHAQWLVAMEENSMSSWWVDHFDRHAAVLFSPHGPFGDCGTAHVAKGARRTLTTQRPPAEWSW
ncbi:hypothetical protein GCM10011374_23320 [Kocuria dechangensis]|uniref:DUF4913 domain-containing protein n=1 Tax=Kocuria dechangensis TaxID=1176249 RepID=A0A917LVR7_9MICC|nr:DUF4913 domain-containing protein [Kocuria dechangensis]GGG59835.1 hypothetical protein GCM10011374_23320 [Kocuria dechangensis]